MKRIAKLLIVGALATALPLGVASCGSRGPYTPQSSEQAFTKANQPMNILSRKLRKKIGSDKAVIERTDDGRMQVAVTLRNRTTKRLNVQVRTVFKDKNGLSTGDETNWEEVWLEPRQSQTYRAESKVKFAETYTVEIREP